MPLNIQMTFTSKCTTEDLAKEQSVPNLKPSGSDSKLNDF